MTAKERPILFSGPMVREIMAGRKTETRRLVTPRTSEIGSGEAWKHLDIDAAWVEHNIGLSGVGGLKARCTRELLEDTVHRVYPRVMPGDTLWVRESFAKLEDYTGGDPGAYALGCRGFFKADYPDGDFIHEEIKRWRPSIHMPRTMCRLRLKVGSVHVERLQDIDDKGAIAEGVDRTNTSIHGYATERFRRLWETINGKRAPWDSSPWVWVVRFEVAP